MTPSAILDRLTALGASVVLTPEGTLRYRGPERVLPTEDHAELGTLKAAFREHKAALMALLSGPPALARPLPPVLRLAPEPCPDGCRWVLVSWGHSAGTMHRCARCAREQPTPAQAP